MSAQKLVSTKIPDSWITRLDELAAKDGLTRSALVKVAIGHYLGLEEVDLSVDTAIDLRSEIEAIKARLTVIEGSTLLSTDRSNQSTERSTNTSTPSTNTSTDRSTPKSSIPKPIAPPMCPDCESVNSRLDGRGKLRADGTRVQRIKCRDCGKGWSIDRP